MEEGDNQKAHRKRQAGAKAQKKKGKTTTDENLTPQQRNPKAFAIQSINKVAKQVRRTLDKKEKRHHIPVIDRTPLEPPPILIAVVGPPKVGKSTVINCLIRNYTRQKLSVIQGPVTLVSGKKRRLTFIECNNDLNSMIDVAKVADLVLLLVDASFGFEMEIFEFLNICQVHGFPKIMGVLTHLDMLYNSKALKKTKKKLKHRFWTEVYQGAKLFYLSGMVNEEYQKTEIHNLGRFISVMKFRPLSWKSAHPYMIADRMEDVTDPEKARQNPKVDRSVCLYGYVRGTHFKNHSNIHIPGCGDFEVDDMNFLADPCPLPDSDKKRSLNQKERVIYAPMSGVGGIVYDKDAVYIELGGSHSMKNTQEKEKPKNKLVSSLIEAQSTVDTKMAASQMSLFSGAAPITAEDVEQPKQDLNVKMPDERKVTDASGRVRRKAIFKDEVDDDDNDDDDDDDDSDEEEEEKEEMEEESESEDEEGEVDYKIETKTASSKAKKITNESDSDDDEDDDDEDDEDDESESADSGTEELSKKEAKSASKAQPKILNSTSDISAKIKSVLQGIGSKRPEKPERDSAVHTEEDDDSDDVSYDEASDDDVDENGEEDADIDDDDDDSSEEEEEEEEMEEEGGDDDKDESMMEDGGDEEADESTDDEEEGGHLKWKDNMALKAATAFYQRQSETPNLKKLIYGVTTNAAESEEEDDDDVGGMFKINKKQDPTKPSKEELNSIDSSLFPIQGIKDINLEEMIESIRDCFVTGKWDASKDAQTLLDQDDDLYGDFEDLETGETFDGGNPEDEDGSDDEDDEEGEGKEETEDGNKAEIFDEQERPKTKKERTKEEKRIEKKAKLKARFDAMYDDDKGEGQTYYDEWKSEMEGQAQLNRSEFENLDDEMRVALEGFRPGMYVRVQINNVPCEFIDNFDPTYPIILGGLLSAEQNIGYVNVRLKKHRWHKRILKTRDPLVISMGWRRFQSISLYSIQDHNSRHRLLKYTPEHLHCHATFWGPITPPGTGMLAVQTVTSNTPDFRIAATGVVLEQDKSIPIVKKLKLTGTPLKIYKKTAFIQGMFNSPLEVAKFEGSSIRTVSGVRGQIKKYVKEGPAGSFRATFEDKIKLSDIVFVRTWYPVETPKFYNPVTSLLLAPEQKNQWQGLKTAGQLRREKGLKRKVDEDSLYKTIERSAKISRPLVVPRELQKNLPFKDKPKVARRSKDMVESSRPAVIREPKERKTAQLMKMLKTLHEQKMKTRRVQMRERASKHQKQQSFIDGKKEEKTKEMRKEVYRHQGKVEKAKERKKARR